MNTIIESRLPQVRELCRRYNVARLELFGSVTTNEWDPQQSDVDVLVTFSAPVAPMSVWDQYMGLLLDLQTLYGRKVDLVEECAMKNRYFIKRVNETRRPVYVAA